MLILKGFQRQFSEVLILQGLLSPVLILLDFKSFIISDLIKNEEFAEVLILVGLGRAMFANCSVFRLRDPPTPSAFPKRRNSQGTLVADEAAAESALGIRRSRLMPHDNMRGNAVSILSFGYSNRSEPKLINHKDFDHAVTRLVRRDTSGSRRRLCRSLPACRGRQRRRRWRRDI